MMSFLRPGLFSGKPFLACFYFLLILNLNVFSVSAGMAAPASARGTAAARIVTGKVTDSKGEPLAGVSIMVKNTKIFAITDTRGSFKISIPDNLNAPVLVFTFIGFAKKELAVGTRNVINVTLTEDAGLLNEIMVVGYGSVSKRDLISSVGTAKMEDIEKAPVQSIDQALAGRIAGVQVSSNDGQPGAENFNIVIRGSNSLTQDNSPLYVVDGFPIENFDVSSLNIRDIESVTVLKDAASASIYGSRGANGVIILETKKGKEGPPSIDFNTSLGFNNINKTLDVMNPYDFVKFSIEKNGLTAIRSYTPADLPVTDSRYDANGRTLEDYRSVAGVDWQNQLFQNGVNQIHNLSLRGGSKDTRYSVSGSIYDQKGIIIETGSRRYQGRISLDQTISKKISGGLVLNYAASSSFGQLASIENTSASSRLFYSVFGYRPVAGNPDIDLELDLVDADVDLNNDYRVNPISSLQNEIRKTGNNSLITTGYLSYKILNNLTLRVQGGLNKNDRNNEQFYNSRTRTGNPFFPSNTKGVQGGINFSGIDVWSNENTLKYNASFGKDHKLNLTAGTSLQETRVSQYGFSSILIPNEELELSGIDEGVPNPSNSDRSSSRLQSYFARSSYNYKGKYYADFTLRTDGSSKFAKGNRWASFPAGAVSWRIKEEKFLKDLAFLNDAKLRASYGITGSNRVNDFAYLPTLTLPLNQYYSFGNATPQVAVVPSELANAALKWETTHSLDLGLDLTLIKNRIELTVDWYRKQTKDLLLNASIPYTSGFSDVYQNVGEIENKGLELSLSSTNVRTKKFQWNSAFNISFNENKVIALSSGESFMLSTIPFDNAYKSSYLYIARVGQPAAQFFGYIFDGIYQYSDFDETTPGTYVLKSSVPANGTARNTIQPGDIRFKDLNGDYTIDDKDQTVLGRTLPKHFGGFNNNFSYGGFNLNVFLQWSYGNQIYNGNRLLFEGGRNNNLNQFASYNNRWSPTNPSNTLARANGYGPLGWYHSRVIEDGSYLRLKTVSLNYALPGRLVNAIKLKGLSMSVSAQNLYTWTNYSGLDPEVSVYNSTLTPGFDFSGYPRARTIVFGLNAKL